MTYSEGGAPSDYDSSDLEGEKTFTVDYNEEDSKIRDDLKRELLLLSSVTNRGEYATVDEQNILSKLVVFDGWIVDLVLGLNGITETEGGDN